MKKLYLIIISLFVASLMACNDDDSFSALSSNILTMEQDTVSFDTVFTRTPTAARYFWVRNNSSDGIRCSSVRLERGNQSGFRVNVDGVYLGPVMGYKANDVEIRKGDSIRVFVELTAPVNNEDGPRLRSDNIIFTLESGVQQKINLNAWTWDADTVHTLRVTDDMVMAKSNRPLVVYDSIVVAANATLTLEKGVALYFHDNAGIDVHGTLVCKGDSLDNVVLRGDRLDNMFDYLPYDCLPGRWQGVRIHPESFDNVLEYTDIHSTYNGIMCDSSDVSRTKLTLRNTTIHNSQGYALSTIANHVVMENCQITNAWRHCVAVYGGNVSMLHCTVGQFYAFGGGRKAALYFSNYKDGNGIPLDSLSVVNSIVTGFDDDVIMGESEDGVEATFKYYFANTVLRTPKVDDSVHFVNVVWEPADRNATEQEDGLGGMKNFVFINLDQLRFDFHLDSLSSAFGTADPALALPVDRDGKPRDMSRPNMGCF